MTITERELRQESFHVVRQWTELPGNVYDDAGEIVLSAGAKVNSQLINQIKRRCGKTVYVDQHWPSGSARTTTASNKHPNDAGCPSHEPGQRVESRRATRRPWCSRLRVDLRGSGELTSGRSTEVTTQDISSGGMSFLLDAFVYPGTEIETTLDRIPSSPRVIGVVRHCQFVGGRNHRVGVQFTHVRVRRDREPQAA